MGERFFAALRMTRNCDSNSNRRSLRDDNKRGNGKGNCNRNRDGDGKRDNEN